MKRYSKYLLKRPCSGLTVFEQLHELPSECEVSETLSRDDFGIASTNHHAFIITGLPSVNVRLRKGMYCCGQQPPQFVT